MAGHSQFKNIMHRKGAQDAKRAKKFTKIIRELTVAAQMGGADPESNPRLRTALLTARGANMPKDTLERAIKKGTGEGREADYTELRYEGYGVAGVAVLVQAVTDNRNRTAAEVRALFSRHGGQMGEEGSVSFLFSQTGIIGYAASMNEEKLFEVALAGGALDVVKSDDGFEVHTQRSDWFDLREKLEKEFGAPQYAEIVWLPGSQIALEDEAFQKIEKFVQMLEDNDDVQSVWHTAVRSDQ